MVVAPMIEAVPSTLRVAPERLALAFTLPEMVVAPMIEAVPSTFKVEPERLPITFVFPEMYKPFVKTKRLFVRS